MTGQRQITGEQIQYISTANETKPEIGHSLEKNLRFVIFKLLTAPHVLRITQFPRWMPERYSSSRSMTTFGKVEQGVGRFLGFWKVSGILAENRQKSKASPWVGFLPQD